MGNKTNIFFTLPLNQTTPYKSTKVVSWAYWVGVNQAAGQAWKDNMTALSKIAKKSAVYWTSPLGALAVGAISELMIPKVGEDVYYGIADSASKDLFLQGQPYRIFDQGNGTAGYRKFTDPNLCQGTYFVLLSNDNKLLGIDAEVKVIAMIETNYYEDKKYRDKKLNPKYEKKEFSEPIIKTSTVLVTDNK